MLEVLHVVDGTVKRLQVVKLLVETVAMSDKYIGRQSSVQFEENLDAVIVQSRCILNAGNQRSKTALTRRCHRVGTRVIQRSVDRSLKIQYIVHVVEHLDGHLKAELKKL